MSKLGIAVWNGAWRTSSRLAADIRAHVWSSDPDIVILTEAHTNFAPPGHVMESDPDYGYPLRPGRRKVIAWSRRPWTMVDSLGAPGLPPGRFVQGSTQTPIGELSVIGICIPWPDAHVSTGRRDRGRWDEHRDYLTSLHPLLAAARSPLVVGGDFNQSIPRRRAPQDAFAALSAALGDLTVATAGELERRRYPIDHVAHSSEFRCTALSVLSSKLDDGRSISDHVGVATVLERS